MSYFARTMSDAEKVAMLESVLGLVLEQTGPISLSQLDLVKAFQEKRTYKVQEMNGFYWVKSDRPVAPITSGGHDLSYGSAGWEATPDPRPRPDHYTPKAMDAPTCKICKGDCGQCGGPCT